MTAVWIWRLSERRDPSDITKSLYKWQRLTAYPSNDQAMVSSGMRINHNITSLKQTLWPDYNESLWKKKKKYPRLFLSSFHCQNSTPYQKSEQRPEVKIILNWSDAKLGFVRWLAFNRHRNETTFYRHRLKTTYHRMAGNLCDFYHDPREIYQQEYHKFKTMPMNKL